jgi:hypothetical protein
VGCSRFGRLTEAPADRNIVHLGTGSFPGLGPKRQGRHGTRSKAPYLLMPERMRTFVVPEGLNESEVHGSLCRNFSQSCADSATLQLRPYVARTAKVDPKAADWPIANTKGAHVHSKRGGMYGPNGFDGEYYIQLSEYLADKSKALKA